MKTDLYTFVHKAHRVRLFHLSMEIGRADFRDPADAARIKALLEKEIVHLRDHARIEEHYIHPLYRKIPDASVAIEFDHDHQKLEKEIEALEVIARERTWNKLHRAYNGFLGRYLVHLEEEEQRQEEILWKQCSDEDLAEVFARFQRERSPEKLRDDLELFLPALSAPELIGMFTGMKLHAPDFVFQFAQGLAEQMTAPAIWAKVKAAIAQVQSA
jgi:hypothetical protein